MASTTPRSVAPHVPCPSHRACSPSAGLTLLEVVIAISVLMVVAAGVAPLFATTQASLTDAHDQTMTAVLGRAKLDQLQGLTWGHAALASGATAAVADLATDLSTEPPGLGGPGLQPGSTDTIWRDTPGYIDYLDADGRWIGAGPGPPAGAVYVRRWAVTPLAGAAGDTLVLEVVASTVRADRAAPRSGRVHRPGDTWLVTLKTRVRP